MFPDEVLADAGAGAPCVNEGGRIFIVYLGEDSGFILRGMFRWALCFGVLVGWVGVGLLLTDKGWALVLVGVQFPVPESFWLQNLINSSSSAASR